MSYSIVVVTWQCADHLERLVDSMNRHLEPSVELVVVDNASTDEPEGSAAGWKGEVVFIRRETNVGFGAAANDGVARARHDAVVLLNPDTRLIDGSLRALPKAALQLNALVGPRVLNEDGSVQPSASGPATGLWPWIGALWPGRLAPPYVKARTEPWRLDRRTQVAWLTGCCIAAPTELLRALGPFDDSIHLYSEDLDLGLRASDMGVSCWFIPGDATIVHIGDGSSSRRFSDHGRELASRNRRRVLQGSVGQRAERRASLARRLNLRLRWIAKQALRLDATREAAELRADALQSQHHGRSGGQL